VYPLVLLLENVYLRYGITRCRKDRRFRLWPFLSKVCFVNLLRCSRCSSSYTEEVWFQFKDDLEVRQVSQGGGPKCVEGSYRTVKWAVYVLWNIWKEGGRRISQNKFMVPTVLAKSNFGTRG
jgi:hypothetical protein